MKKSPKVIFHIDMNAFYAQVAIIKDPYLKNEVFVVGGKSVSNRGVITTASYKARKYGIKSGMAIAAAQNIYPRLLIVPADFDFIRKQSNLFFEFLKTYSDRVLKASIDEAYLDVTKLSETRHPLEIAKEIQDTLNNKYLLPSSIGIAPTLFLAKMGSDMKKPLGITVIRKKEISDKILPLPISRLFGVGIKTYPLLEKQGIKTIGDFVLRENLEKVLKVMKYEHYLNLKAHIYGESSNVVDPTKYEIPKSISNETTFNYNIEVYDVLVGEIDLVFNESYQRLLKENALAKTVSIKLRDSNFNTITRSKTINDYSKDYETFKVIVDDLFYENFNDVPIRLIGVGFSNIILESMYEDEYNLFTYQKHLKNKKWYNKKRREQI